MNWINETELRSGKPEFLWSKIYDYTREEKSGVIEIHLGKQNSSRRKGWWLILAVIGLVCLFCVFVLKAPAVLAIGPFFAAFVMHWFQMDHKHRRYANTYLHLSPGVCQIADGNKSWDLQPVKKILILKRGKDREGYSSDEYVIEVFVCASEQEERLKYFPLIKSYDHPDCKQLTADMAKAMQCPVTEEKVE